MSNSVIVDLLLIPTRLCLWFQSVLYWFLVYGTAGITAGLVLTRIAWRALKDPYGTFQWTVRKKQPACLRDPTLGKHGYLWGRVRIDRTEREKHRYCRENICYFYILLQSAIGEYLMISIKHMKIKYVWVG